jgi:phosphoribosylaminoimidazolecarboxamide formyltransferase/IMP cyclohydrolase
VELRYGINPEQLAQAGTIGEAAPIRLLSGRPSYINLLDALNAWQLVREAAAALSRPVAASFKHVSPVGAAVPGPIDAVMEQNWAAGGVLSPAAMAYIRARDCDPKSSFGDFAAVSEPVDLALADILASVISDGVIAPGFEPGVTDILARKKRGTYVVIEADPRFEPPQWERREVPPPISAANRSQWLRQLTDVAMASDGYLPFRDNIDQAARHGVRCIAHPGGSARAAEVQQACDEHNIALVNTGIRLFHH